MIRTAPWRIDISSAVVAGQNQVQIEVTNVWANRLIGDELEPADLLWQPGEHGPQPATFLKEFPDWFLKREPRPSRNRFTSTTWNYFNKPGTPLIASGLLGPVRVILEG